MQSVTDRFVVERTNPVGFGWCKSAVRGIATVQYFDLPGSVAEERQVPMGELVVADLPLETRVWVRNRDFGWWPGRTKGRERNGSYFVKLAGAGPVLRVPPWSIQVRWNRPLTSPTDALAIGMTDSLGFYTARAAVMSNLVRQRSACRGFAAVLSASVRPFHHQIDVLTRVLNDPIMRFVLADEVGLGKTIESGLVVRQAFLDRSSTQVVIAAPRPLTGQWVDELNGKLRLGQELADGRLRVVAHSELLTGAAPGADLLVIDEAHQLVESGRHNDAELATLRRAAHATPSLLLLTATPLRGNAETFLGLLHLVDSEAYPLDDVLEFQRRLEVRHSQAASIELLVPGVPKVIVSGVLEEFKASYDGDSHLQNLIRLAEADLSSESPSAAGLEAVADHMRETYRLSRRVIRHRRSAAAADGFPVSGRRIEVIEVHDPARELIDDFMEQWRVCLLQGGESDELRSCYASGVEAGLAGAAGLLEFVDSRLADLARGSAGTETALLRQTRANLLRRGTDSRSLALLNRLTAAPQTGVRKTVVFTGFDTVANGLATVLRDALGEATVACHLNAMDTHAQDAAIRRFVRDRTCSVLLCDSSGEEGRNLQCATELIHLDLPLSVNRLEQRIGRVDRFNETSQPAGVPSVVISEPTSAWVTGHLRLLSDGVGVFDQSVATLQRPLADHEQRMQDRLLAQGPDAFELDLEALRLTLDDERIQIDLLEELEGTLTAREFGPTDLDELFDFEDAWRDTSLAFDHLTSEDGGIRLRRVDRGVGTGVFQYTVDPSLGTVPLMAQDQQDQLIELLPTACTFDRTVALRSPEAHLLRLGNPLVDWIERYLRVDEGGRTRAVWRHVSDWSEPEAWFGFDFLLEFESAALQESDRATRRRLGRRGDAFLPPRIERVWTDGSVEATDEIRSTVLESQRTASRSDVALRGPRWSPVMSRFPDWTELCARAEEAARAIALARLDVVDWRQSGEVAAGDETERRMQVLKLWADRLPPGHQQQGGRREIEREQELGQRVMAGVASPRCSTFAVEAVIVAGVPLDR